MRIAVTAATALLLALSAPAGAQHPVNPMTHDSKPTVEGPAATPAEIERLIGTDAVAADGRKVGTIENLLVSPTGRVDYVVLEWGGVLGLGAARLGHQRHPHAFGAQDELAVGRQALGIEPKLLHVEIPRALELLHRKDDRHFGARKRGFAHRDLA